MGFFALRLSKDGKRLDIGMSLFMRLTLAIIALCLAAVYLFAFTEESFNSAPLLGKINVIALPVLVVFGSLFEFAVRLDRITGVVTLKKGLVCLYHRESFQLDDRVAIDIDAYRKKPWDFATKSRWMATLHFGGKEVELDRGLSDDQAKRLEAKFLALFPDQASRVRVHKAPSDSTELA